MVQQDSAAGSSGSVNWPLIAGVIVVCLLVTALAYSIWRGIKQEQAYLAAVATAAASEERSRAAEVRAQEATEKLQALTSSLTAARAQSQDLREDLARAMARARPKAPFVPKGLHVDAIAERLNSTRL